MRPPRDLPPPVRGFTVVQENGLYCCDVCGWWVVPVDVPYHGKDEFKPCNKAGGKAVKAIIAKMPELRPVQNGYGDSNLAFQISVRNHVTGIKFSVDHHGRFRLESVHHYKTVPPEKVEELARFITEWSKS